MPIRKYSNSRFTVKRFTAPGIGSGTVAPINIYSNLTQIFTSTTSWTVPTGTTSADYLVVAGGGGGGGARGGGGGGGGFRIGTNLPVTPGQTYTITVGAGGANGAVSPASTYGSNGTNSTFASITATGGGGGGAGFITPVGSIGYSGGSGGGGAVSGAPYTSGAGGLGNFGSYTPVEGYGGGSSGSGGLGGEPNGGGGGGGASANGTNATPGTSGNGGAGAYSALSGSNTAYAGGGGGGTYTHTAGTGGIGGGANGGGFSANTNSAGGGGGGNNAAVGGAGGSGIVVIKYAYLQSSTGSIYWNLPSGSLRTYNYGDIVARPIAANVDAYALNGNLVFTVASGSLPTGTSMLANGFIYGTASAVSQDTTSTFTVLATNTLTGFQDQRTFSITVKAPVTANYNYTGADQTLTLPATVNTFVVHAWGGGGGAYPGAPFVGGAGGYTTAVVTNVSNANSFVVVVGQGGDSRGPSAGTGPYVRYGGGGQVTPLGWGGQGGGLSGVFANTGTVFSGVTAQSGAQARAIVIAGGGGGSGDFGQGGEGGGLSGNNSYANDGTTYAPYGAGQQTDTNNGYDGAPQKGSALTGGNAGGGDNGGGGGGGAGYYGGGGGTGGNSVPNAGGGGSGYVGGSPGNTVSLANSKNSFKTTTANTSSVYYANNAGRGGSATVGDNGRVVIIY